MIQDKGDTSKPDQYTVTQLQTDYILVVNYKTYIYCYQELFILHVIKIQLWYHIRN